MINNIKNISVIFIGAGNLATNLAKALYKKGFCIQQVYSRTEESAKTLAHLVESTFTTSLEEVTNNASLYIVSLTDDALLQLLPNITKGKEKALIVHTAGSISIDIWNGYAQRFGVLYPMQTFSKKKETSFQNIPFFIESNSPEDTELLKKIASTLSDKVYYATSQQRCSLHLAAVFTCNFTNHMYALAAELLEKNNLPFDVMIPLIDETAAKVHLLPPCDAQTGPAARNDEEVMRRHLKMLSDDPATQNIYKLLSDSIISKKK